MVYNKKGFSATAMIIAFVFIVFFFVLMLGVAFYSFTQVNSIFAGFDGIQIGAVDFQDSYEETLGAGLSAILNSLSATALALIMGMIIAMLIVGYNLQEKNRLLIAVDLIIIVAAFIIAVYLSQYFETFINTNTEFLDIYSNEFELASTFILTLPISVPIIGVLVMLVTYATVKKKEVNVYA